MKKKLSFILSFFMLVTGVINIAAQSTSVTVLCEPFFEKYSVFATNAPEYWSVGNGLSSKIINTKGETVFSMIATGAKRLNNNVFLLTMPSQLKTNEEKLVDFSGKKLTDKKLDIIEPVNDNALIVKIEGKTGIYDFLKDEMITEAKYKSYKLKKNSTGDISLILLNSEDKAWDILDMRTLEIKSLPESLGYSFLSEKYLEFTGDKQGIADINGNIKYVNESNKYVRYIFDNVVTLTDYAAKAISVCDMEGNVKSTFSTEKADVIPIIVSEDGTVSVLTYKTTGMESRLKGIMKPEGTILTEEKYYITDTYPGAEIIILSNYFGEEPIGIDFSGNVVLPEGKYKKCTRLKDGFYSCYNGKEYNYDLVRINGKTFEVIDTYGNIHKLNDKYLTASKENKTGIINYFGEVIVPFEYKSVEALGEFLFAVKKDNKIGVVDCYGKEIIECKYDYAIASGAKRQDKETLLLKDAQTNMCTFIEVKNNVTPEISVKVGGVSVNFDQNPVIADGRTLVPLRAIFEALGADVSWNGETRSVTAIKGDITVSLTIDSDVMTVNGKEEKLDVPAKIIGGRTLVPARAVSQALGYNVSWDGETRCVGISR